MLASFTSKGDKALVWPSKSLAHFLVGAVGLDSDGCVFLDVNLEFPGLPLNYSVRTEQFLITNLAVNRCHHLEYLAFLSSLLPLHLVYARVSKFIFSLNLHRFTIAALTVTNGVPWIFTVGASNVDQPFATTAILPNGLKLKEQSISKAMANKKNAPLIHAKGA